MSAPECRHPGCGCPADARGFCGPYCANAAGSATEGLPDTDASACSCGHPACTRAQKPARDAPRPNVSIGSRGRRTGRD